MKHPRFLPILAAIVTMFSACAGNSHYGESEVISPNTEKENDSPQTFTIRAQGNEIAVKEIWDSNREEIYAINELNPERIICMSSSHVAFLSELGCIENIVGISGTKYICNRKVKEAVERGEIAEVGSESSPDYEKIVALDPTLVIAYGIAGADNSYINNIRRYGKKVLVIGDYLESSPLGRLAYIKLFGAITGKSDVADSIFTARCSEYHKTQEIILEELEKSDAEKTKVLINAPFKGVWYVPGEKNYTSKLIKDAGGVILGTRSKSTNSSTESMERMMMLAQKADVWLNPNSAITVEELAAQQPLLMNIPAARNGRIYNNNLRQGENGGSDIWESGYLHPDLILKDLALILHPEMEEQLGHHTLYYHRPIVRTE